MEAIDEGSLKRRKPQTVKKETVSNYKGLKTRRRTEGGIGPCTCIAMILLMLGAAMYGGKGWRVFRGYVTRDYISDWVANEPEVTQRAEELLADPALGTSMCQLPAYPDTTQVTPTMEDFNRRFWVHSRLAVVMIELGSINWAYRSSVGSKSALENTIKHAGSWTLHYDHSNKTEVEHHVHLEKVFNPSDKLAAPWAEVDVEPSELSAYFFPLDLSNPFKLLVVPALSGHAPTVTRETFYLSVLSGRVHLILYRNSHSFHVSEIHVHNWHNEHLHVTRSSGNHGKACILVTDQAVLIPSGYGYAFIAVTNTVLLKSNVVSGY